MGQLGQEKERVYIGAQVDRRQRDELIRLARRRDRSVSSIIRRALAAGLERVPKTERGTDL
jgi:predicted transcriptional regulator